jgi:hypothetical protein
LTGIFVQLDKFPEVGVPSIGVTRVGLVESTLLPEPVVAVAPVPPLPTAKEPAKTIAPAVAVLGVNPVPPALKDVTPPLLAYWGILRVLPLNVAAPLVPFVVRFIVPCLLLNVFQSAELR